MKKVLFSVFFFSLMVVGVQAQKSSCSKSSCTAKPAAAMNSSCGSHQNGTAASANSAEYHAAAAKLASTDPTIETKTNPVNGEVCYVRKLNGATTGEATYVDLTYDATSNTFVNVSPVKLEGCAKSASGSGKSCCAPGGNGAAKATSGTTTTTTGATTPACCAGKTKTATASSNKN